jgi:serine-threonine kinase receptor-associated protein
VKSSRFSSDSKKLLTGGQDKILRVFDLEKPEAEPLKLEGHTQPIRVALYSNESTVISAGQDSVLRIWDVRSLKEVKSIPAKAAISSVELSLDGKHVTTTAGKEVTFFNLSK